MPPGWSPGCGIKWSEWDRKVDIWEDLTSLPVSKRGPALSLVLGGEGRKIADKVPLATLKRAGSPDANEVESIEAGNGMPNIFRRESGLTYLRRLIGTRFGIEDQDKAIQVMVKTFSLRRKR